MAWLADLAGKAENLLVNLDEQTGAAIRNHSGNKGKRHDRREPAYPEPQWMPKKRPIPRGLKNLPTRKPSPSQIFANNQQPVSVRELHSPKFQKPNISKSPVPNKRNYNPHHCPRTVVGDMKETEDNGQPYGYKPKRYSMPSDLQGLSHDCLTYRLENLEVENAMLKNELNVTNREIKELIDRLRKTEEGETNVDRHSEEIIVDIDCTEDLQCTTTNFENMKTNSSKINKEKELLSNQLEQLKCQLNNLIKGDLQNYKDQKQEMESEIFALKERNKDLEELVKLINHKSQEAESMKNKVEHDLRHAHSTINMLQSDLEKSNNECKRLDKEWESYKNRVKSMLAAKDKEINALQQGVNFSEDTKILMEQVENLKEEREALSEAVKNVRNECGDMKQYVETLENRHNAGERLVLALRDALKEERLAKTKAETQLNAMAKELKNLQIESGQTIASLRLALRDKDQEFHHLRNSSSTMATTETSALNVADYDISEESLENEKVYLLTQKLVQKQGKIDMLLADNNILKIQLEKLESKIKMDMQNLRNNTNGQQSVVQLQDGGGNTRSRHQLSLSRWFGKFFRHYPMFRVLVVIYMVCLHLWVFTVLFTNTPENRFYLNA